MRAFIIAATFAASIVSVSAMAQSVPSPAAVTSPAAVAYTTAKTRIGTLLDDPAARAILDKHIPGFSGGESIDMARSMTLKAIQQYAPEAVTDKALENIDADLSKLVAKK